MLLLRPSLSAQSLWETIKGRNLSGRSPQVNTRLPQTSIGKLPFHKETSSKIAFRTFHQSPVTEETLSDPPQTPIPLLALISHQLANELESVLGSKIFRALKSLLLGNSIFSLLSRYIKSFKCSSSNRYSNSSKVLLLKTQLTILRQRTTSQQCYRALGR